MAKMPAVLDRIIPTQKTPEKPIHNVTIRLSMPEPLFEHYETTGFLASRPPEEEIVHRLQHCKDHTAQQPLYFDDAQRNELERATGWQARTPESVIARLHEVSSITLDDIKVEIPVRLRTRLESRVFKGQTFEGVIRREVIEALEKLAGIRPY